MEVKTNDQIEEVHEAIDKFIGSELSLNRSLIDDQKEDRILCQLQGSKSIIIFSVKSRKAERITINELAGNFYQQYTAMIISTKNVLFIAGIYNTAMKKSYAFDLQTKQCRIIQDFAIDNVAGALVEINNAMYLFGNTNNRKQALVYNENTNAWENLPNMPISPNNTTACVFNEFIYITGQSIKTVAYFNPLNKLYTQIPIQLHNANSHYIQRKRQALYRG